jgi:hypothetical protein
VVKSKAKVGANAAKAVVVPTPKAAVAAETETTNVFNTATMSFDAVPIAEAEKIRQQQSAQAVASTASSSSSSSSSSASSSSTSCVTGLLAALMITLLVVFALCLVFPPMRVETERALAVAQGAVVRHSAAAASLASEYNAKLQSSVTQAAAGVTQWATSAFASARQYVSATLNLQ